MASISEGKVVGGVEFAPINQSAGTELQLRGAGLFRFGGLIRVTASALYLPSDVDSARILDDVPKALVIEYYRSLSAEDLVRSGNTYLSKNLAEQDLSKIADEVDQINQLYQDVRPGDRYTLAYMPGVGTRLLLNGEELGMIPGSEFGRHYFTIWLGSHPVSESMRDDLLDLR